MKRQNGPGDIIWCYYNAVFDTLIKPLSRLRLKMKLRFITSVAARAQLKRSLGIPRGEEKWIDLTSSEQMIIQSPF